MEQREKTTKQSGKHSGHEPNDKAGPRASWAGRLGGQVSRYPWLGVLLILALVALAVSKGVKNVAIDTTAQSLMLEDDPAKDSFDQLLAKFGSDEILVVAISSDDPFAQSTVDKSLNYIEALERQEGVRQVKSVYTAKHIHALEDDLRIDTLIPDPDDDAGLRRGMLEQAQTDPLFTNTLISGDGRTTGVLVFFEADISEKQREKVSVFAMEEGKKLEGPERVYISGSPSIKVHLSINTRRNYATLVPAILLLVSFFIALVYRSPAVFLVGLFNGLISIVATIMIWFGAGRELNPFTGISPVIIAVIALAYVIHAVVTFHQQRHSIERAGRTTREWYRAISRATFSHLLRPLTFICLTTVVGFGSLMTSEIKAVRQMGMILVVGMPTIYLVTLFGAIPALQMTRALLRSEQRPGASRLFERLADYVHDHRRLLQGATALFVLFGAYGVGMLQIQSNSFDWFREGSEPRVAEQFIRENLSSTSTMNLYLLSDKEDQAVTPEFLQKAAKLQALIVRDPDVEKVVSLVDYVRQLNQAAHADKTKHYTIPNDKLLIKQYFYILSDPDSINRLTDDDYTSMRFFIRVKPRNSKDLQAVRERVLGYAEQFIDPSEAQIEAGSTLYFIGKGFDRIATSMLYSMALALSSLFLIIAFMVRSARKAVLVMLPNVVPVFLAYGAVGLMGFDLDFAVSTVACSLLGIAVDDSIHFTSAYESHAKDPTLSLREVLRRTMSSTGLAMAMTTLALCLGLSLFNFASLTWITAFGTAMVFGLLACFACDVLVLPGALQGYYERRTRKLGYDCGVGCAPPNRARIPAEEHRSACLPTR